MGMGTIVNAVVPGLKTDELRRLYEAWSAAVCFDPEEDEGEAVDPDPLLEECRQWCEDNLGNEYGRFLMMLSDETMLIWQPHERAWIDRVNFVSVRVAQINRDMINRKR